MVLLQLCTEHLHLSSEAPETSISTSSIATLCLTCLALRREEFSDFLEDSEDTRAQRRENVFKHRQFLKRCEQLDDFHIYILDKLEAVLASSAVVDTLHYADSPEIEAFLRHFHLSMLRLRPPSEWTRSHQDIGSFQGLDENVMMETISGEEHLRSLLNEKHFDLQLVHYQYTGFEHFDIVHSVNGSYDIASQKKAGLAKLMSVLELCFLKFVCSLI